MKAELKERWLAALRSGKYPQGVGSLRSDTEGYCCLGVLCDVFDPNVWVKSETSPDYLARYGETDSYAWLPTDLECELRLTGVTQQTLAEMNDDRKSFDEIADYIEENVTVTSGDDDESN